VLIEDQYLVLREVLFSVQCQEILDSLDYSTFQLATPVQGTRKVQQNFSYMNFEMEENRNSFTFLCIKGIERFLGSMLDSPIAFNDVVFQRYTAGESIGIAPHHDKNCFIYCIAILLLKGDSNLYIYEDGEGKNPRPINAKPGDCILLRAPGIGGEQHGPYHGVANVTKERITLTLRHQQ